MFENIQLKCIGTENGEDRLEFNLFGFDTELRVNIKTFEGTVIITDEIARYLGCKSADELLGSNEYLDFLNKVKKETGAFPEIKFRSKNQVPDQAVQTTIHEDSIKN